MIITEQKPFKEVLDRLDGCERIVVLGCGRCATSCDTGGEKQVEELRARLEAEGKNVVHTGVVEAQCDERLSARELRRVEGDYDCIVSMGCGSGASAINDLVEVPVISALNTLFLGVIRRKNLYEERCSMCGECVLGLTLGICPVTRCSKGLLNGPCGGSSEGKCEVDGEKDCAWTLIIDKLEKNDKLGNIENIWAPKNYRTSRKPQVVDKR